MPVQHDLTGGRSRDIGLTIEWYGFDHRFWIFLSAVKRMAKRMQKRKQKEGRKPPMTREKKSGIMVPSKIVG